MLHRLQIGFFLTLTALALFLTLWLFWPFFNAVLLAIVIAIMFRPMYEAIRRRMPRWPGWASFLAVLVVIVVILVPLAFFAYLIFQESVSIYNQIVQDGDVTGLLTNTIQGIESFVNNTFGITIDIAGRLNLEDRILDVIGWLRDNLGSIFNRLLSVILGTFIFILALFYIFRDGGTLRERLIRFSPLRNEYDSRILDTLKRAVNAVIKGHIVIAIIQGLLTGFGFWLFNVPSPAIWGFVAAIASFIPSLGTGLVIAPAIIYLFFAAGLLPALGMLGWGAVIVGLVDNILAPILIDRRMHIHPFLILVVVLGGIEVFGPIGFVVGPVILALLFALLEIYPLVIEGRSSSAEPQAEE